MLQGQSRLPILTRLSAAEGKNRQPSSECGLLTSQDMGGAEGKVAYIGDWCCRVGHPLC